MGDYSHDFRIVRRKAALLLGACAGALAFDGEARGEVIQYGYDALGRLVSASTSGGPNGGLNVGTAYDPAGNRSSYTVGAGGAPPPYDPPPANQPPVTSSDLLSIRQCATGTKDVVDNDTDPEGNYPLSLVSVTQSNMGAATIVDGRTIQFEANFATGDSSVTYRVRDSLGATSTGTLHVQITAGGCD